MDKEEIAIREQAIIELIEVFSSKYLNEEIHELCVKLVKKLGRKRDVLFRLRKFKHGLWQLYMSLLQKHQLVLKLQHSVPSGISPG
jgi:hypothetical protein